MPRQSISFTPPNDDWLKTQVDSQEFASKSEVVNDLIRKAREIQFIREKLIAAELSGHTTLSVDDILEKSKQQARDNGLL